ncbi:hypothetical protein IEQ34_018981 [Dendrobium chrysotoxum]|uniref:Fe2OG dioxygenase domain-containing protein n=1 Tax=Dendrobium chrysotoxum TaxID=161865 RepID=A0AAV7G853_DENCH|nr:hypothetical protein IEQ34_018981 [Dendrobium chrysotoxum]
MHDKGRVTIQFRYCYNYAVNMIPPGILRNEIIDHILNLFKIMINRLITSHILPINCVPDNCIINIYEPGDCIPPHIDSHDFIRPFCTVSFLSKFVLALNGNGSNLAKHCIPAVSYKRISVTFRKMDKAKRPYNFKLDSNFQNIKMRYMSKELLKSWTINHKILMASFTPHKLRGQLGFILDVDPNSSKLK